MLGLGQRKEWTWRSRRRGGVWEDVSTEHGDLKAANVHVYDDAHCVISDFEQSEMKLEVYKISGTTSPHAVFFSFSCLWSSDYRAGRWYTEVAGTQAHVVYGDCHNGQAFHGPLQTTIPSGILCFVSRSSNAHR